MYISKISSFNGGGGAATKFAYKLIFKAFKNIFAHRLRVFRIDVCYKPEVAGSNPDELDFFASLPNPCSRTMALGSTLPEGGGGGGG
jgi:hypothetical protein